MKKKIVFLIPIYKNKLIFLEEFSLKYSLNFINKFDIYFISPHNISVNYYNAMFPGINILKYSNLYFESIFGYNKLLLNVDFYKQYKEFEFILILQPDAILIKDDINKWLNSPIDYIGAPWPSKFKLNLIYDQFRLNNHYVECSVGNGGLSLRRVDKVISLFDEFSEALSFFIESNSSEDLFFSSYGLVSNFFNIPNEIVASHFSLELNPDYYFKRNKGIIPFGGHAWWKYNPNFWLDKFDKSKIQDFELLKKYAIIP